MLAILSNSIENADRLSENLQYYWNSHGVYASVSLFEDDEEFINAFRLHQYKSVILQTTKNTLELIVKIRDIKSDCKIGILIDTCDRAKETEIACTYRNYGVEMVLTRLDLERPLELISKQLSIV